MAKATPRQGICVDCGETFKAGKTGVIASRCTDCRNPKARTACLTCGADQERTRRANGSIARAPLYCSPDCKPRCAVSGCDKPRRKREWCANHYATWFDHGDVHAPLAYRWAERKVCMSCGLTDDSPEWEHRFRKYCSRRCATLWRKYGGDVPASIPCATCGVAVPLMVPVGDRRRRRSDTSFCDRHARHARAPLTAADLAEQDGAWCRLCGEPVDMALRSPHRLSASVDHIVPRAMGGTDERSNLQLAHRGCNSSKRHRYVA